MLEFFSLNYRNIKNKNVIVILPKQTKELMVYGTRKSFERNFFHSLRLLCCDNSYFVHNNPEFSFCHMKLETFPLSQSAIFTFLKS